MKKNLFTVSMAALMTLAIAGCGEQTNNSSTTGEDSSKESLSSFTSSSESSPSSVAPIIVEDFKEALLNTKYYLMSRGDNDISEFVGEDLYYKSIGATGYFIPDEDSQYVHDFSCTYNSELKKYVMSAYGRSLEAKNFSKTESSSFLGVVSQYVKTFEKVSDTEYCSTDLDLLYAVAYFFESKMLQSLVSITFTIDENGRICSASGSGDGMEILSCSFKENNRSDLYFYNDWVASGSKITTRISDLKNLNSALIKRKSLYEGESVKFNAVITGIDANGDIYVANAVSNGDNVGIRIEGAATSGLKVSDNVEVEATISSSNNIVYGKNGKITYLSDGDYLPSFSEESIVDSYGGGYYAYYYFNSSTYYSDTLYTTYAYVSTLTEMVDGEDTVITLAFPAVYNATSIYYAKFVIPSYLNEDLRTSTYQTIKAAGLLGDEDAYLLCFDSIVMRMNGRVNGYSLQFLPSSSVYKKLTVAEKVEKICGLKGFAMPSVGPAISYGFGKGTQYNLESQYGITTEDHKNGLFVGQQGFKQSDYDTFLANFESLGVTKYEEIGDKYDYRHLIYTYNGAIIDMMYVPATWSGYSNQLSIWIYKADASDLIRCPSIQERIKDKASWFDTSTFLKLQGSYDADYHIYEISNYAGTEYETPLIDITLDLNYNAGEDYKKALVQQMGYKQYKVNGKSYTYTARGQVHYIFQKEEGQFLDIATYPTTDYIYTGHNKWSFRTEIMLYEGTSPISVKTYSDLSPLANQLASADESLVYTPNLPSDTKVELWTSWDKDYNLLRYGYGHRDEAFVYTSNIDEAYEAIKSSLEEKGYELLAGYDQFTNIAQYNKMYKGNYYYVFVMKTSKGYVRVANELVGSAFAE